MTNKLKVRCSKCGTKVVLHIEADDKEELEMYRKDIQKGYICDNCKHPTAKGVMNGLIAS